MRDARLVTHEVLGQLFFDHAAVATFRDSGIVLFEADCVLLASFLDASGNVSDDTLHILWLAGDMLKAFDAVERAGAKYVIWERELNRRVPSSRVRRHNMEKLRKTLRKLWAKTGTRDAQTAGSGD